MENKKGTVKEILLYAIIGILVGFFFNQGLSYALNTETPMVAVASDSMIPVYYPGDLLIVKGANITTIKEGDIIVFRPPGFSIPIVHRVTKIYPDNTLRTRGDHNKQADPWKVKPDWIIGKVIISIPKVGYLKLILLKVKRLIP
ncbi:MAG: signal peptidase I [Candidatus Hydrothermarchaeota archaeon]